MSRLQIPLALKPPRRPAFENFVAGPNRSVVEVLSEGLEPGGWYFLGGAAGSGKTHLLSALLQRLGVAGSPAGFAALDGPAGRDVIEYLDGDWVMLDDVDALAGDSAGEMRLFNALNRWRGERTGVVMSGRTRAEFALPDLRSRLSQATGLALKPLSDSDLVRLVQSLAFDHEVALGRGAAEYLVTRVERNPATVVALMQHLATRALSEQRTVSVPLIREAVQARPG